MSSLFCQPQLVRGAHWRLEVLPQCVPLPTLLLGPADLQPLNEGHYELNDPVPPWVLTPWGVTDSGFKSSAAHRLKLVLSGARAVRTPYPGSMKL